MFGFPRRGFEIWTFEVNTEREDNNTLRREARDLVTFICTVNRAMQDRVHTKIPISDRAIKNENRRRDGSNKEAKKMREKATLSSETRLCCYAPAPSPPTFPHL